MIALLSSAFLAFGLYQVHSFSGVTEGGVLGMTLLLDHWFGISPAVSGLVMNLLCYAVGWKLMGRSFILYSMISSAGFSLSYWICEQLDRLWPSLAQMPLVASVVGAVFVGIGAGFCVRVGGAPSGDDALAMGLSHLTHIKLQWVYLMSDIAVLLLSASYIPLQRLWYSFLTVILSGQIIGLVQKRSPAQKDPMGNALEVK